MLGKATRTKTALSKRRDNLSKLKGGSLAKAIKEKLTAQDVVFHDIIVGTASGISGTIVYIDGLVDKNIILHGIIKPLAQTPLPRYQLRNGLGKQLKTLLLIADLKEVSSPDHAIENILKGKTAVLFNISETIFLADTRGWKDRCVESPSTELSILGANDSFTENMAVNIGLIRRRIANPNLSVEYLIAGDVTKTSISMLYIQGSASEHLVSSVREKLSNIQLDAVLEGQYLIECLEGPSGTPFPLIQRTERPDKTSAGLLAGKVVILVDNTPFAMILPTILLAIEQGAEDYYHKPIVTTSIRLIRAFGLMVAVFGPGLYVALVSVNVEVIPTFLALAIAGTREGLPYPVYLEAFLLSLMLELLIEAALRLPKQIGSAVTIVGGLVIGEAAVRANLVSEIMLIIIALTAIGTFTTVNYSIAYAWRIWKYVALALSTVFGLFGLAAAALFLLGHLSSLSSFGVPYLTSIAPFNIHKLLRDTLFRQSWAKGLGEYKSPDWTGDKDK